ncbi:FG-GAP-like repeat-containing protein, partial [Ignavibacterium album]|uniref:FG-GAP-like repeat-containing protein n=1 Tax=Ignavibacterium album TaxID=591197 RepID=UPI0038B3CD94
MNISNPLQFIGPAGNNIYGQDMISADVNGDNIQDLIVSANYDAGYQGRIYVYYGGADFNTEHDKVLLSPGTIGLGSTTAGDINGDGYDDIIAWELPSWNIAYLNVHIFMGAANMSETPAFTRMIPNAYPIIAGDINNDGFADIFYSRNRYDNSTNGKLYCIKGASSFNINDEIVWDMGFDKVEPFLVSDFNRDNKNDISLNVKIADEWQSRIYSGDLNSYLLTSAELIRVQDNNNSYGLDARYTLGGNVDGDAKNELYSFSRTGTYKDVVNIYNYSPLSTHANLIAHYTFDDNTNDLSGNNLHGQISGSVPFVTGKHGRAVQFNGNANNYVKVPHNNLLNFNGSFTITAWINSADTVTPSHVISKGRDIASAYSIGRGGKTISFNNSYGIGSGAYFPGSFPYNEWHFVAGVIDNETKTAKYYLNGVKKVELSWGSFSPEITTEYPLVFGRHFTDPNGSPYNYPYPFTGLLDEVRIFDKALTESEIVNLFGGSVEPSLHLLSPNGMESWTIGTTQRITWSSNSVASIKIELTTNGGDSWVLLNSNVSSGSGFYDWIVDFPSNSCRIRISDVNNPAVYDVSDNYFSIMYPLPAIPNLVSPPNNSLLNPTTANLEWTFAHWAQEYNVQISLDHDFNNIVVDTTLFPHSGNQTYQYWNLSDLTQYFWRVRAKNSTGFSNWSEIWNFTTKAASYLTILSPNGGEEWLQGSTQNILWESNIEDSLLIQYSTNNGANWIDIARVTSLSSPYHWEIPNNPSETCLIKITSLESLSIGDLSNSIFTIQSQFTELNILPVDGLNGTSSSWGDYDNDGFLDLLVTGMDNQPASISKVLRNNGSGGFVEQSAIQITGVVWGSVEWGDYNRDGYLDILLSGLMSGTIPVTKVYKNNRMGGFIELSSLQIPGVQSGSVSWGDSDNDGDLDILMTGWGVNSSLAGIYTNNGDDTFTLLSSVNLLGVSRGSVAWNDFNNDGYLDFVISGYEMTKLYKNSGNKTFSEINTNFVGVGNGCTVDWQDFNNDGWSDLLVTGLIFGTGPTSKLYKNNKNETFTELSEFGVINLQGSSVAWGDYNNDGKSDIAVAGYNAGQHSKVYENISNEVDSFLLSVDFYGIQDGSVEWADYDNDKDLDLLISGGGMTKIFRNNNDKQNQRPEAPSSLSAIQVENEIILNWERGTDIETPQAGLNYNVWIGTGINNANIVVPMANISTGLLKVVRNGNSQSNSYKIKDILPGKYYWSVQSIDGAYSGSQFANIDSFQVVEKPMVTMLELPENNSKGLLPPIVLVWKKTPRAERYILQVSQSSQFNSFVVNDSVMTDTSKILSTLSNFTQYYWRVKAANIGGQSDWSEVWSFKTLGNPYASTLIQPVNNSVNHPLNNVVFKWTKARERIETIQKYQYQLSTDSLFANVVVSDTTLTDTTKSVSGLSYLTKYFWRVRAGNQTGWGDWSAVRRLTTIIEKPPVTLLSLPLNNTVMQLQPVTVVWQKAPRAERYILEVSQSAGFSSFVLRDTSLTDTFKVLPQLAFPQTYYWRVRSANIGGVSDYSSVWNFRTLGLPLMVTLLSPANNSINQPVNSLLLQWRKAGEQTLIAGAIRKNTTSNEDGSIYRDGPVNPVRSGSKNSFGNSLSDNPNGISNYWLQVTGDTSGSGYLINDSTVTDTIKLISGLNYSTPYYWRVMAKNETGWGGFSGWFSFTTIIERPLQP